MKNYLYIPLGGNRNGNHMRNILITMFLGGLWHGAGWTFIFWGILHGIFICINHLWRKTKIELPKFLCWLLTFNAVNIAWVFFRANSFESAMNIVKAMFDVNKLVVPYSSGLGKYIEAFRDGTKLIISTGDMFIILLLLGVSVALFDKNRIEKTNLYLCAIFFSVVFLYAFLSMGKITEFLYFQF